MAPWGGNKPLYGTNPIAFAAPRAQGDPLLIDLSLSHVARGKVMLAQKAGEPIPEGWALDVDGNPTTDADAAMAGTMVPSGGAKGAALALMVELLTAGLAGANFAYQASSLFDDKGDRPRTLRISSLCWTPRALRPVSPTGPKRCSPPSRRRTAPACPVPAAWPNAPPAPTRSRSRNSFTTRSRASPVARHLI